MSELKARITADMKQAMRDKDKDKLQTIRMLTAAIKQREVDDRKDLDDADVLGIVEKLVKQRREAEKQYIDGGRPELAAQEVAEAELLMAYLPEQLSDDELAALIDDAIAKTGAESMRDMGKVMGVVQGQAKGKADMGKVSGLVKAKLG